MFLALHDVPHEGVVLYSKIERRPAGRDSYSEIRIARSRFGEQEEVGYAERSRHGGIIAELVVLSLLSVLVKIEVSR